ncbi:MAG: DUF4199 domain-containing protein [Edaphobacter sp.]
MKKTILTFGIISGILSSVMMCGTIPFLRDLNHGNKGYYLGYTAIVLSFLLVFFGIRSYRDNLANGGITFGRAFAIGIGITLISCVFYVVTWEIISLQLPPRLYGQLLREAHREGPIFARNARGHPGKVAAIRHSQQLYENPLVNALYTFIEPFPVGLVITLISAAILRRKPQSQSASLPATA